MTTFALTEQQKALNAILDSKGFDFIDASEIETWHKDGDDMQDEIQSRIYERNIIYYSNAIAYLSENDPSLMESLELASDAGYEINKLNSELLATLLYQQKLSDNLGDLLKELEAFEFQETAEDAA